MLDSSQASGHKYPNRENLILRATSEAFLSTFTVADSRYTLFRPPGLFSVDMGTACHFFGSAPESALAGTASLRILNPASWRRLLGPASVGLPAGLAVPTGRSGHDLLWIADHSLLPRKHLCPFGRLIGTPESGSMAGHFQGINDGRARNTVIKS